ncbi:helicase HerA domain-containing protein [Sorangium sp. So ce1000]|uniref:helicase HerA domain-containing protein n=1 Tax=Sorangium sp. So ce1000 TaxID=3133325 RepID=UPI003F6142DE
MSPILSLCDGFQLDLSDYARTGLRVGIWASSGRGKSFGVGVLCEELLAAGIPVVAIDPEGELYTLRERFRLLVLGGAHADLPLPSGERAAELALARVLDEGLGLVVDLSDQPTNRSQQEAALPFLERLWVRLSERRAPAALVIEEVQLFAPQSGASLTSDILHRFAKQGRKRGVLLVVASQRTQAVSKELMSQLNFPAIGGFEIERDYDAVKALVDGHTFEEFRALPAGEFFLPAVGRFERWRARHTAHGGEAPSWTGEPSGAPRVADATLSTLIDELREALAAESASQQASDPSAALRAEIRRLQQLLARADEARRAAEAEAERLRTALQVAGVVKVVIQSEIVTRAGQSDAAHAPAAAAPRAAAAPAPRAPAAPAPGVPMDRVPEAPALSAAPAPGGAAVKVIAKPASPSLRDLAMPASAVLEVRGVKQMVSAARSHARRRSPRSVAHVALAAKLLAGGAALTAEELAARGGSRSQVEIRRAAHALAALARAGFASLQGGRHALNEPAVLRAIQSG